MKYSQASQGRVFIIRLEDGDILHHELEKFATDHSIKAAFLIVIGGADTGSKLVVGPARGRETPVVPMEYVIENVHEITGTGTLFPDNEGNPVLHMHVSCGRESNTITGCVRQGVKVWHVMEVILVELIDTTSKRVNDSATGFKLLEP